jgi:nucleotide-binding universal stress UspA family protein
MFNKILVPLDGSTLSERALPLALTLGQLPGAEVILARVPAGESMPVGDDAQTTADSYRPDQSRTDAQVYLDTLRLSHQQPGLTLRARLMNGHAASAIVDAAVAEHADLIVMSTHGYSGVTRWLLGSVTEKVLRTAPCPVLAVRAPDAIQHIAITLDGSELSERALGPGLELAQRLHADMTLLRCVPYAAINGSLDEVEHGLGRRLQQDLIDEAAAYLTARSASSTPSAPSDRSAPSGVAIKTEVRVGPAADNIYEFVEAYGTDLIVMATHGRTGVQRWVYGSVTEKVLHSVNTSLLVVRPVTTTRYSMRSSE